MENTLRLINDGESILFVSYNEFVHQIIKSINKAKNNVVIFLLISEIDFISKEKFRSKHISNI